MFTVDDLRLGQFLYLLMENETIRSVVDTLCYKVVLILGNFAPQHKPILDALRVEVRKHNLVPVVFDCERPEQRDIIETIRLLAGIARFIIGDITALRTIGAELQAVVPDIAVPIKPILRAGTANDWSVLDDMRRKHPWVLDTLLYKDLTDLVARLVPDIIQPATAKAAEIRGQDRT